jgi:cytochrome c553
VRYCSTSSRIEICPQIDLLVAREREQQVERAFPAVDIKALKTADGQPFMYDGLARYGYIPDSFRTNGLPVGFTVAGSGTSAQLGMTCAACHTREITRDGFTYRVDGGPALSDFQGFLTDMVDSVGRVLGDETQFQSFAKAVLGPWASKSSIEALRKQVTSWHNRENTLKQRGYGTPGMWGLGRLDAVAMIFNRLTGLDLGKAENDYIIADNIQPADAPTRYPFLWNAAIQDLTQWPGFSGNGTAVTGLARNTGEVLGVFATFHPKYDFFKIGNIDFKSVNSSNGDGLLALEKLVKRIGSPKWPAQFPITTDLVARGQQLYTANCSGCHGVTAGKPGFPNIPTWATPLMDVKTDSREYDILARTADPGVLMNMSTRLFPKFKVTNPSRSFDLLKYSVIGTAVQKGTIVPALLEDVWSSIGQKKPSTSIKTGQDLLEDALTLKDDNDGTFKYESRVMFGIWAAAPYLHNGSVPTLADLLKPVSERPVSFAVGPNYDAVKMGLAATQPGNYSRTTTGCEDRNSGNSRCGHEGPGFGTNLPEEDKRALLEYMKTL